MNLFQGKTVVLGVTGSIAAYKAVTLASQLHQAGAQVFVAMTDAATNFVAPLTFASLTHHSVALNVLALDEDSEIAHVRLAKSADLVILAPATANTLAKIAHGFADDVISALVLSSQAPLLVAPAMETGMWNNPATRTNLESLRARGISIIEPNEGHLASGAEGKGRMAEPAEVLGAARLLLARSGALAGKRVVVTAGGTREPIDPVRVISNISSGKMGYALAEEALSRGASVQLITGVSNLPLPYGALGTSIDTTEEMRTAVLAQISGAQVLIMAAAPADFRPARAEHHKIKKEAMESTTLELVRNPDILSQVDESRRKNPPNYPQVVVGFAAETEDLLANAREKLERKRLDLIVANPVPQTFGSDLIQATLLSSNGQVKEAQAYLQRNVGGDNSR